MEALQGAGDVIPQAAAPLCAFTGPGSTQGKLTPVNLGEGAERKLPEWPSVINTVTKHQSGYTQNNVWE